MNTPLLAPIHPPAPSSSGANPSSAFRVLAAGVFQGRRFEPGDVILCRGEPRSGDQVVLVARRGRPRLGRVQGTALWGDRGERCHPDRWAPAGRLVAVLRQQGDGKVAELVESEGCVPEPQIHPGQAPVQAAPQARQLPLFAA